MTEDNKEVTIEQQQPQNNGETLNEKENLNGDKKIENGGDQATETNVEPPKEMKCIQISSFGGPKMVKVLKKPEPLQPADGEVVVRVHSAGLSFNDVLCRQGNLMNLPKAPFTLGFEAAGVIESVGENVVDLKVGDRVACLTNTQAFSELVLVNSKYVYQLPENIDFDNAVALTLNYVFAHYLLFEVSNLKANQTIFIQSCGGGVGQALVQLASTLENITIIGTASKHKHEKIENVTHLFDHADDYVSEIKKLFPEGINLVLAPEYSDMNKLISLLRPLGHYVLYGSSNNATSNGLIGAAKFWWQSDKIKPNKLFEENKTISGFNLRQYLYSQNGNKHVKEIVEIVYKLFLDGKIKPTIDSRHAFEDVADAMLRLHDRQNVGKVILDAKLEPKPKPVEEEKPAKKSRFGSKSQKKVKEEKTENNKVEENGKVEAENGKIEEEENKPALAAAEAEVEKAEVEKVVLNGNAIAETNGEVKVEN